MSAGRFAGSWLIGLGAALLALALVRGQFGSLAYPIFYAVAGFLLLVRTGKTSHRFPATNLEVGLERLFTLLLLTRRTTSGAGGLAREVHLLGLRRGARRWGRELELITTDGYETTSRIAARCEVAGEHDERALVAEAVRELRAERGRAGADLTFPADPVSMLAYGLGAQPAKADLTSLDDLLCDLGLAGDGDELRTRFDDVMATESSNASLHLRGSAQRRMFCDLAGASFVLGAAQRILELASNSVAPDTRIRPASG